MEERKDTKAGEAEGKRALGNAHKERTKKPANRMKRGIGFVLALLLLTQCKVNQGASDAGIPGDENYIGFYSKKNGATIRLYQNGFSCLRDSLLESLKYSVPRLIREDLKLEQFDLEVTPFVKDSTSCEGLYIYGTFIGGRTPRSLNGMPYHFCAINGNDFLFFNKNDTEGNRKKLDAFKGEPIYSKILKYEKNILNNLILIK